MRAMMSGRGMELAMRAGPGWEESAWMLRFGRGCRLKQVWHTAFLNHLKHRHERSSGQLLELTVSRRVYPADSLHHAAKCRIGIEDVFKHSHGGQTWLQV